MVLVVVLFNKHPFNSYQTPTLHQVQKGYCSQCDADSPLFFKRLFLSLNHVVCSQTAHQECSNILTAKRNP